MLIMTFGYRAESCGLQSPLEKLFLAVATMLDTKYREPFDKQLLGKNYIFILYFSSQTIVSVVPLREEFTTL
jgi:hypothetical protein